MDRIYEGYHGGLGALSQENSQKRIDWICECVKGKRVLDIGCSQGICEILLSRKGKTIIGIDCDEDAIEFAKNTLKEENEEVRNRVRFLQMDFLDEEYPDDLPRIFDTVLLTEVLEHLHFPIKMVEKAAALLKENGEMIVTVPFGVNDHPDHKQTFYINRIIDILSPYVCIENVNFMGRWIGFVCKKSVSKIAPETKKLMLLPEAEDAIEKIERDLQQSLKKSRAYSRSLKEKLETVQTRNDKAMDTLLTLEDDLREERKLQREREERAKQLEQELTEKLNDINAYKAEVGRLKVQIQTLRIANKKLMSQHATLSSSLGGKFQLKIWKWKEKVLYKHDEHKTPIRDVLKRIPLLKWIVTILRGDRTYQSYYTASSFNEEKSTIQSDVVAMTSNNLKKQSKTLTKAEYYGGRTDEKYFDRIREMVEKIPDSNGSRFYERSKYRIGCVVDEFQYETYRDTAQWIYLKPYDYEQKIDLLMIVSPWRGIDQAWVGVGNLKNREMRDALIELIRHYKKQAIPVVFYSKEDQVNYQIFVEFARECDYIFTSESDCIPDYIKDTGNQNVAWLPFSVNPICHNPIGSQKYHLSEVFFAGTWWGYKYEERMADQKTLVYGVLKSGRKLRLIDRNYDSKNMSLAFPEDLLQYVSPSIPHVTLQKVHKLYDWCINLNSIKYGSTMFASRVFEVQALGCSVLSNPSKGMQGYFPDVPVAQNEDDVVRILNQYQGEQLYEQQMIALRNVMSNETVFSRFDTILTTANMLVPDRKRTVLVLAVDKEDPAVREAFQAQTYQDRILCSIAEVTDEVLAKCACFAFFHPDYQYGSCYLEDMINGFKYTDSDFITKDAYYEQGKLHQGVEHDFVETFRDRYKTVFWCGSVLPQQVEEGMHLNGYSIDHFQLEI